MLNVILQGSNKEIQQFIIWYAIHSKTQLLKLLNVLDNQTLLP